jgi:hypothetical protein
MSEDENDNSLEVIEKPKRKITQKQREAGIENLKKGPKSRETKILNNNNFSLNPYLDYEKILNPKVEETIEKPVEVKKVVNHVESNKYLKDLEKKIDIIASMNLETNKKVNKLYEYKKAKKQIKIEQAVTNQNNTTSQNNNENNDLYSRLKNKIENKIKKIY